MSKNSADATSNESSNDVTSSPQEVELVIRLDTDDADMPEMNVDDVTKLDISTDNLNLQEREESAEKIIAVEKEKLNKTDDTTSKQCSSNSDNSKTESGETVHAKSKPNSIWVSNIGGKIKAADLKKLFNQAGKVSAVKILTNGKNFYGYVSMENAELADKCVQEFHNTVFQGEKLSLSKIRPDLVKTSENAKIKFDKTKKGRIPDKENKLPKKKPSDEENVQENKPNKMASKIVDNNKVSADKKIIDRSKSAIESAANRETKSVVEDQEKEIIKLHSKIDALYSANTKLKIKFEDMQRLYNGVSVKYNHLKIELKKSKTDTREELRRLNLEKENFEKLKRAELARLDDERSSLHKELSETKRLKETLKIKIDEIKFQKTPKRGRSPVMRDARSPRRRPSPISRGAPGLYRSDQRPEKKFRRSEGFNREHTPPPPNLNAEMGKRPGNPSNRTSYIGEENKFSSGGFEYRPSHVFQTGPQSQKGNWIGAYPKDQRRGNLNPNQGNNFPNVRYTGPSTPYPSSSVVIPPKGGNTSHYYQHW